MRQFLFSIFFLCINFGSLGIGKYLMNEGPRGVWYSQLEKAPWTPPGFLFGIAWTLIMICFSLFLGKLFVSKVSTNKITLFFVQLVLNIGWNYIFFNKKQAFLGLICIVFLAILIFLYYFKYSKSVSNYKFLLLPYMIWLCIAISLNFYIVVHN